MEKTLFRKSTLERLASPEQVDQLLAVGSTKSWLIAVAVFIVLAGSLLWGLRGKIPESVEGYGMLTHSGGVSYLRCYSNGVIDSLYLREGVVVAENDVIARLRLVESDSFLEIKASGCGRVIELLVATGDYLLTGEPLAIIEPEDSELIAVLYVPLSKGKKISPRMQVNLCPSSVKKEEYGYLQGWVESVSAYPVSQQSVTRMLGSDILAQRICEGNPVMQVNVELLKDYTGREEFFWTSRKSPTQKLSGGTGCSGIILTGTFPPIELLFR